MPKWSGETKVDLGGGYFKHALNFFLLLSFIFYHAHTFYQFLYLTDENYELANLSLLLDFYVCLNFYLSIFGTGHQIFQGIMMEPVFR